MRIIHFLMSIAVIGACMALLLTGCAKAPDQELAAAKAAIKTAQDAEADKYMPNNFQNVQKAMAAAEAEIERQNSVFALSRKYTNAQKLLKNVIDLATQIAADAPTAKENLSKEIEQALVSVQKKAKETRDDVKKAPRSKGKQAIAQMKETIDAADKAFAKAAEDFAAGNILEAQKQIGEGQRLLKKINDQLSSGGAMSLM